MKNRSNIKKLRNIFFGITFFFLFILSSIWLISPFISAKVLNGFLEEQQLALGEESHIRFNPFSLTLTIRDVSIQKNEQTLFELATLNLRVHPQGLTENNVKINEFVLSGLSITVLKNENELVVAGIQIPQSSTEEVQSDKAGTQQFSIELPNFTLKNASIDLQVDGTEHNLKIDELNLADLVVTPENQSLNVNFKGAFDSANLNGKFNVQTSPEKILAKYLIELQGLKVAKYKRYFPEDLRGASTSLSLEMEGIADLKMLEGAVSELNLSNPILKTQLSDTSVSYQNLHYGSNQESLSLNDLKVSKVGEELKLSVGVDYVGQEVVIKNQLNEDILANWSEFELKALDITLNKEFQAALEQLRLKNATFSVIDSGESKANEVLPLLSFSQLAVNNTLLDMNSVAIDSIELGKLSSNVILNQDKQLDNLIDIESITQQEKNEASKKADKNDEIADNTSDTIGSEKDIDESKTEFNFAVKQFSIGSESTVVFVDQSVEPNVKQNLEFDSITIGEINSERVQQKTPFHVEGSRGEFSRFSFDGEVAPLGQKLNLNMKGKLNELSLPEVSPYVKSVLGFEFKSGQLDTTQLVEIKDDILDGKVSFDLRGIQMEKSNNVNDSSVLSSTAIPLNVALGMITDKKGNLKLKVPISGDINDPSFGWNDLIKIVLKKAALSQAKSYLMNTFVPYSQVVSVALSAGGELLKVRMSDLIFEAGQSEISEAHGDYLEQFIKLMKDKPKMQVKVCPISTPADIGLALDAKLNAEQEAQLLELGNTRSKQFKLAVIERGEVESSRILVCSVKIDSSKSSSPRIEFSI